MPHVSRPLIGLLVATVAVFALWYLQLRPQGSSASGSGQSLGAYQSDINAAHNAVKTSDAASARAGGAVAPATGSAPDPATVAKAPSATRKTPSAARKAATTAGHAAVTHKASRAATRAARSSPATPASRLAEVERAMRQRKVLALLFYNPAGADDRAVKRELGGVPTDRGRVVKLVIPVAELPSYSAITEQAPVNFTPTLVVIAPNGQAEEIAGFADEFEISERVADALAAK